MNSVIYLTILVRLEPSYVTLHVWSISITIFNSST